MSDQLKDVILPAKLFFEDENKAVWGYFSSYRPDIPDSSLTSELDTYGLTRIANSDCDYLLFIWDKKNKKLTVGLDNTMNFSCYFTVLGDQIVFSSKFSQIKNIVAQYKPLIADLDGFLTYMYPNAWWPATEKTILESVKMVPPGSIVEFIFEPKISYQIRSLVDIDGFLSSLPRQNFKSDKEFAETLEANLTDAVARRLEKIPSGVHIGCEISSGFDCTFIAYIIAKLIGPENFYCYSFYFPEDYGTESLKIISKFADKHSLKLRAVKLLPVQGYARDYFSLWKDDDLLQLHADYYGDYIRFLEKYSPRLLFTGQHGDEIYSARELAITAKYSRQICYFETVRWLKKENQGVLYTSKALDLLLNWERFNRRRRYPLFVSENNIVETALINEIYMDFGTRQVSPYLDSRVVAVGIRRGEKGGKPWDEKQIYAQYLDHIFIPEMFIPKKGGTEFVLGFSRNQKCLISWVMRNSVLAQYGLVDPKKIMEMMADEQSPLYQDPFVALAFEYLIRADWYLIKNKIKLSL
ncbi:MAG: asparagine synthase-related protein [Microgenomates group bacterium]